MMRRNRKLMMAVAILCGGSGVQAGVVTTNTPFTGTTVTTDLSAQGNQNLPWTDPSGRTVSLDTGTAVITGGTGLEFTSISNQIVFANLDPNTQGLGFTWRAATTGTLMLAVFSNGDTYSVPTLPSNTNAFLGFLTDTPFTSVTFTISSFGVVMPDFMTKTVVPPVPEPATLISSALGALGLAGLALRRRRVRA